MSCENHDLLTVIALEIYICIYRIPIDFYKFECHNRCFHGSTHVWVPQERQSNKILNLIIPNKLSCLLAVRFRPAGFTSEESIHIHFFLSSLMLVRQNCFGFTDRVTVCYTGSIDTRPIAERVVIRLILSTNELDTIRQYHILLAYR